MHIMSIIGTRPQFYKLDPKLSTVVVNTGQHYDEEMDSRPMKDMKIRPKYNLGCTSDEVGKMIDKCREVIRKESPDVVLVYGDTYSTLAGALAASLEGIKFGHIESGLRAHDMSLPEETNRIVADRLATWKFCPTHLAMRNLLEEGLGNGAYYVGDPLFWSMKFFVPVKKRKDFGTYIFATIHRRENLNEESLREIFRGFGLLSQKVYFPMHPHTKRILKKHTITIPKNVEIVKPQPRKQTLERIYNSSLVITDSGGIQREAYWMARHSLIIRPITEWMDIVEAGWANLIPAHGDRIKDAVRTYQHLEMPKCPTRYNPYEEVKEILHEG